jgi:exopolysaccharide biosynthesis polyprenyl glycosylphosphotransferase
VSSAAPFASSEITEGVLQGQLEQPDIRMPPGRRHGVMTVVGRITVIWLATIVVLVTTNPRPAVLPFIAVGLAYLIMRGLQGALPPAARFRAVTGVVIGVVIALGTMMALALLVDDAGLRDGRLIAIALGTLVLAAAFESWMERYRPPVRVLVVGGDAGGEVLAQHLSNGAGSKWSLVGLVTHDGRGPTHGQPTPELRDLVLARRPDLVVLSECAGRDEALDRLLKLPVPSFQVFSLDHFCEYAFGRVSVWSVSPLWFMSLLHAYRRPYRRVTKRALDLLLAVGALVLAWPVIVAMAVLVRLSGPGPVVYRQARVGEAGKPFEILKFRTMTDGAEADGKATWANKDDPRVTRVGRFLRRYRLDEIPQIWNIVRGDMSVVGPRPERPEFVEVLEREVPHWSRRHLVKPGLTGWAQVRMGYADDMDSAADKLAYDLYYVKHRGLLFDLAIVLRTVSVVTRARGAQ